MRRSASKPAPQESRAYHSSRNIDFAVIPMPPQKPFEVVLRVGTFVLIALVGYFGFPIILQVVGVPLVTAAFSSFGAAAVANAISLRFFERARLADIGL